MFTGLGAIIFGFIISFYPLYIQHPPISSLLLTVKQCRFKHLKVICMFEYDWKKPVSGTLHTCDNVEFGQCVTQFVFAFTLRGYSPENLFLWLSLLSHYYLRFWGYFLPLPLFCFNTTYNSLWVIFMSPRNTAVSEAFEGNLLLILIVPQSLLLLNISIAASGNVLLKLQRWFYIVEDVCGVNNL